MFDVVTCVVSIGYLIHPIQVLKELHRILKPNGKVLISQSSLYWPNKIIQMWIKMNEHERLELIDGYFFYAGGYNTPVKAYNITATISKNKTTNNKIPKVDHLPIYMIEATKL